MKWAQAHEIGAAFFELHVAAHDIDDVDTGQKLLDEGLGNGHGAYFALPDKARCAAGQPPAYLYIQGAADLKLTPVDSFDLVQAGRQWLFLQ